MFKFFKIIVSLFIFIVSLIFAVFTYFVSGGMGLGGHEAATFVYVLSFLLPIFGLIAAVKFYNNTKQPIGFITKFIIIPLIITPIILMVYIFT